MEDAFFGFAPYHVLLTAIGVAVLLAYLLTRLTFLSSPSASPFLMLFGLVVYALVPGMPAALDPTTSPGIWEATSELVVIVVLFATGLRIDNISGYRLWQPTVRLLAIAMPLTIVAVAFLGWALAGMTIAGAVLLGAALAPTDPVLAGDVQVGPPLEGKEHPVRFALTTEAGLNDGLAFPFVYLGLLIAVEGADPSVWFSEWMVRDVLYRIAVGVAVGSLIGWLLGKILFAMPDWHTLAKTGPGVIALAGVLLCYGLVELAEGYGFIGAFAAGLVCRRVERESEYHRRLHAFCDSIEHAVTAVLLLMLGSTMPALWSELDWRHSVIGFGLLFVIRPVAGWLSLLGTSFNVRERCVVAFFGVRGIGSIYYLAYASGHIEFTNEKQLWALVAYTVFASTVIHGLTGRLIVDHVVGIGQRESPSRDNRAS
jgi:NhaP-type Na+/H+ or K+/H+ antiporter